jgi:FG-GAP-like repeat/WW domain
MVTVVCATLFVLCRVDLFYDAPTSPSVQAARLDAVVWSEEKVISAEADGARSVYAADLECDGDMDVLSASEADGKISWYENNGDGTFSSQPRVISTHADGAWSVYVADLDGDGDIDVLSASWMDNKIAWYENMGDSTFSTERVISRDAQGARSVFAMDLDGDGDIDVLSASDRDDKVAWYENHGAGVFSAAKVITQHATGTYSVFAADLDNDGDTDVLCAITNGTQIVWFENDGSGNFSHPNIVTHLAKRAFSVYAADIDGDGNLDILSASADDNKVAWYKNDGDGTFSSQNVITTQAKLVRSIYAVDMDGDGDMDVLSASTTDGRVAWYENTGYHSGTFSSQKVISSGFGDPWSVFVADVDGDGDMDVLTASNTNRRIGWFENTSGGTFSEPHTITSQAHSPRTVHGVDLDGDGDMDVLSASLGGNNVTWYENLGDGTFGIGRLITDQVNGVRAAYAADLNGDGNLDVLSASRNDSKIAWYANDGSGNFSAQHNISTTCFGALFVYAADLNCDNHLDVLSVCSVSNTIVWYENLDGSGIFSAPKVITKALSGAFAVDVADLDNDGDMDVLSASEQDHKIAWYRNMDGAGTFSAQIEISIHAKQARAVYAADLDGDGDLDVLSASRIDDKIAWYENTDGDGTFSEPHIISLQADRAEAVYAADMDGDGDMDVLSASSGDGRVSWYENIDGDGTFSAQKVVSVHTNGVLHVGDMDGDGDLDVLSVSDVESGDEIVWFGNNLLHPIAMSVSSSIGSDSICYRNSSAACATVRGALEVARVRTGSSVAIWVEHGIYIHHHTLHVAPWKRNISIHVATEGSELYLSHPYEWSPVMSAVQISLSSIGSVNIFGGTLSINNMNASNTAGLTIRTTGSAECLSSPPRVFVTDIVVQNVHMSFCNYNSISSVTQCQHGGGILVTSGSLVEFQQLRVRNCSTAIGSGGGMSVADGSTVVLGNGTFANCSSSGNGGAVAVTGVSSRLLADSLSFSACVAGGCGGALAVIQSGTQVGVNTAIQHLHVGPGSVQSLTTQGHTVCASLSSVTVVSCSSSNGFHEPDVIYRPTFFASDIASISIGRTCLAADYEATQCRFGTIEDMDTNLLCSQCSPGEFTAAASTACTPCPFHYFTGVAGSTACQQCSILDYAFANRTGSQFCEQCAKQEYLVFGDRSNASTFVGCLPCPTHADCSSGMPEAEPNFWVDITHGSGAVFVYECSNPSACLGAAGCGDNRLPADENPLCAACIPGHQESGGECVACESTNGGMVFLFVLVLILLVQTFFFLSQGSSAFVGVLAYFAQTVVLFIGSQTNTGLATVLSIFDLDFLAASKGGSCILRMSDEVRSISGFFGPFLAFISWIVLFSLWSLVHKYDLHVRWFGCTSRHEDQDQQQVEVSGSTTTSSDMVHRLSNPTSMTPPNEVFERSHSMPLPWCICLSRAVQQKLLWFWYKCYMRPASTSKAQQTQWQLKPIAQDRVPSRHDVTMNIRWIRTLLALFTLTFNGVTRTAFSIFRCIDISDDGSKLTLVEAFPTIHCHSASHQQITALAGIMCAIYISIPIILVWMYPYTLLPIRQLCGEFTNRRLQQHQLPSDATRYVLGALTAPFRGHAAWWKIWILFRRLVLVLVVVFVDSRGWRMVAASIISLLILMLHVLSKPFLHWIDNVMEGISLLTLVLLSTILVQVQPQYDSQQLALIGVVWAIPFLIILFWAMFGWIHHREICKRKTAAAAREEYYYKYGHHSTDRAPEGSEPCKIQSQTRCHDMKQIHHTDTLSNAFSRHGLISPVRSSSSNTVVTVQHNHRTSMMATRRSMAARQHTSDAIMIDEPGIQMCHVLDEVQLEPGPDQVQSDVAGTSAAAAHTPQSEHSNSTSESDDHVLEPLESDIRLRSDERCAESDIDLPSGWHRYLHDESGIEYFYNESTKQTQWERPSDMPLN